MTAERRRSSTIVILFIIAILIAAIIAFRSLFEVIIVALSLAVIVTPLFRYMENRLGSRRIAAMVTTLLVLLLFVGTISLAIWVVYNNREFIGEILTIIVDLFRGVEEVPFTSGIPLSFDQLSQWAGDQVIVIADLIAAFIRDLPLLVIQVLIMFLGIYLFLLYGDQIWTGLVSRLPATTKHAFARMTRPIVDTFYAIYVVHFSTAALTFILALPFFTLLGYGHVLFFALVAGIFQLFPMIGDSALMIFLLIYAISQGDIRGALLIIFVGYPIVTAFPDMYYRPLMMGNRTAIHPVLMWIGFFGGVLALGTIGILLGPLFIAIIVSGYAVLIEEIRQFDEPGVHHSP